MYSIILAVVAIIGITNVCIYIGFHSQSKQYYTTEVLYLWIPTWTQKQCYSYTCIQPTFISSFTRQFIIPKVVRTKYTFFSEIDKRRWSETLFFWRGFVFNLCDLFSLSCMYTGSTIKVTYASQATDTDNYVCLQRTILLVCLYFSHLNIVLVLVNFITIYSSAEAYV